MIGWFKRVSEALQACARSLDHIVNVLAQDLDARGGSGALEERVQRLEVEQDRWAARVEAELLKADQKYKLARASEERERHARRAAEGDEEGEDALEAWRRLIQEGHVDGGGGEAVPALPGGVETAAEAKHRLRQLKLGL